MEMRKVKSTIHWVSVQHAVKIKAMLYETLVLDAPDTEEGIVENPNSLTIMDNAYGEPCLANATTDERFQFMRNGYFCLDMNSASEGVPLFNRTVAIKSSYKP